MERYLLDPGDKPLCLASFGPPGSGKSMGIKQIAVSLAEKHDRICKETLEVNLSEVTAASGLARALHRSRDLALSNRIPVVLIDEFDCTFDSRPLGWLKYLLAPMQDGTFREGDSVYRVGSAILVFVGGTRRTFEEFAGQMRNRDFIEAKGPDFVSRLRGHVNVRGINRVDHEDRLYPVRRAAVLRFFLTRKLGLGKVDQLPQDTIDRALLRTFLRTEQYHHGVRSLEQIIKMSDTHSPRRQLTRSSLPQHAQLDMHVDAAKFWETFENEERCKARVDGVHK